MKTPENPFARIESEVRSYCRSFPTVFTESEGARLKDEAGKSYIDFFAGAGTLNYGHNNPILRDALIKYIQSGGVTHALDMSTVAKRELLLALESILLQPRGLDFKVMFPGPTGTNAVESALKLARKVTGRTTIMSFTNAFHGMTLGSLAITGNVSKRNGAGIPLGHVSRAPFDGYLGEGVDTIDYIEDLILDGSSGIEKPAAFILETIQAEGGVNVADASWLKRLRALARKHDILFIVDDIQVGCGRTGGFFSFEGMDLDPDMICLSKSLSGYGLPFALTMFKRELDQWAPGEHNGTFRGFNLAFTTARVALETYWQDDTLKNETIRKSRIAEDRMRELGERFGGEFRGRGLIQGIAFEDASMAGKVSAACFERGLIMETAGARGDVLKLLPPLVISDADLLTGLEIVEDSLCALTTKSGQPQGVGA